MNIEDKIDELIKRPNCFEITFQFGGYGKPWNFCTCYIEMNRYQGVSGYSQGDNNMMAALEKAAALIEVVRQHNLKFPPLDKQPSDRGFYREMIDEVNEAEYRRFNGRFYLTRLGPPVPSKPICGCF